MTATNLTSHYSGEVVFVFAFDVAYEMRRIWHLARIYQGLSARFHLGDWHRTIDEKLKTLDDLYQLLRSDRNNRWMLKLEITVIVLFVIDLVLLLFGARK